jgi:hypothetical protein
LGLSSTTDKQKEAARRMEFEALGEQSVLKNVKQGESYKGSEALGGVSLAFQTGPVAGPLARRLEKLGTEASYPLREAPDEENNQFADPPATPALVSLAVGRRQGPLIGAYKGHQQYDAPLRTILHFDISIFVCHETVTRPYTRWVLKLSVNSLCVMTVGEIP